MNKSILLLLVLALQGIYGSVVSQSDSQAAGPVEDGYITLFMHSIYSE